jgi:uncharacterized protein YukE
MSGPIVNYPPEIVDAVVTMHRAAMDLEREMGDLQRVVSGLVNSSSSGAIQAFNDAQQLWNKSGLAHNETLAAVAHAAGDSYEAITSFDAYLASQFR